MNTVIAGHLRKSQVSLFALTARGEARGGPVESAGQSDNTSHDISSNT